ncbi:protrudin-like isoform X1 [Biomphalaria glabrata]|uniref:Protrudin n=1 Tax=Biomphalaria glabrata TaxID=6526 RepID=A0A9U8DWV3_BIOGL|nr:protrudin-like isoform X1 [Biomphalaria glabrata]XP_013064916.2 protrudin-like isoform X1 [Biomphalaria glabrata]XP_013064917.2 protrudin-like isoform X1 [Biomphalaria glabrata]XP_055878456.1 protrudin-like isoform X1 [Biomphalaria glabrata]XP_055878471.1 protrudin-like isoform X1 [Biomphalaria glabrata]KAI8793326.1 protrudin isoform X1 [Biomphalaria glabrata]
MGKTDNTGKEKETSMVLDLSDFVTEVDRFSRLIEPFALVFYFIDDLRRWRFCKSTIVLWLICNVVCIWISQGAVFVLASSLVIGIATVSLFQIHTGILGKLLPSNEKTSKVSDTEEVEGTLSTVQNFRYSLIEMHDFVVKSNEYLNYFYSIIRWDSFVPSVIYHTEVCVFLLSIVMCPARWNCFLIINWFFLCHPHIIKRGYKYFKENKTNFIVTNKPSSEEKKQVNENEDNNDDDLSGDDSSDFDMTDSVSDTSMIQLDPSPSKPGMVARLMEIKKRRKQTASETCLGCKVSFASILKKRLYCRHCGYSFCNRCCYQKVPRSVFGATSPAALKETVLVCCSCHAVLTSQSGGNLDTPDKPGPG